MLYCEFFTVIEKGHHPPSLYYCTQRDHPSLILYCYSKCYTVILLQLVTAIHGDPTQVFTIYIEYLSLSDSHTHRAAIPHQLEGSIISNQNYLSLYALWNCVPIMQLLTQMLIVRKRDGITWEVIYLHVNNTNWLQSANLLTFHQTCFDRWDKWSISPKWNTCRLKKKKQWTTLVKNN